jgi:hypothetical protein
MPQMLDKSRFCRRLQMFFELGQYLKMIAGASDYVIDSFPVAFCDNMRISRCKLVSGKQWRGRHNSNIIKSHQRLAASTCQRFSFLNFVQEALDKSKSVCSIILRYITEGLNREQGTFFCPCGLFNDKIDYRTNFHWRQRWP